MGVRKTNILRLDEFLDGGLRHNTITTLWAYPGVQNSPFAYRIAVEALKEGDSCVYVTCCKNISSVEYEMRSFGWDAARYVRGNRLIFVDAYSGLVRATPSGRFKVKNPKDVCSITKALEGALASAGNNHTLVVYDSVSTLIDQCGSESLDEFLSWKNLFRKNNATGVFLFTEWPYELRVLERLEELSDAVVALKAVEDKVILQEYLTLPKMAWGDCGRDEVLIPFKIDPFEGVILLDPE
ncbi:MAG: RAD55 family ATPase [Candidatus Altiarchaeia archaeon]